MFWWSFWFDETWQIVLFSRFRIQKLVWIRFERAKVIYFRLHSKHGNGNNQLPDKTFSLIDESLRTWIKVGHFKIKYHTVWIKVRSNRLDVNKLLSNLWGTNENVVLSQRQDSARIIVWKLVNTHMFISSKNVVSKFYSQSHLHEMCDTWSITSVFCYSYKLSFLSWDLWKLHNRSVSIRID